MNAEKEDLGVMLDYTLDLAYGKDENDFECKIVDSNHCCDSGYFLYIENTEYGGIIDGISVDTQAHEVTYLGRTWHGILESKVLKPNSGDDYLVVSGEANTVLTSLVSRMGLSTLFSVSPEDSGITISKYKMNRYIAGYSGIKKMLKEYGAKLIITFKNGAAELSAKPIVDYSHEDQYDQDQIDFKIQKRKHHLNHIICLGKGDLAAREVIHVYSDGNGNISTTQVLTGLSEIEDVYDNANAESSDELKQGGIEMIEESWNSDEIAYNFNSDEKSYDIGDIVGAREKITGIEVNAEITKKIVTIQDNTITISYEVGE